MPFNGKLYTPDIVETLGLKSIKNNGHGPNYVHPKTKVPLVVYGNRDPKNVYFDVEAYGWKRGQQVIAPGRQERHAKSGARYSILSTGSGEIFFLDPKKYWEWGLQQTARFPKKIFECAWRHPGLDHEDSSLELVIPSNSLRRSPAVRYYYPSLEALEKAASKWA